MLSEKDAIDSSLLATGAALVAKTFVANNVFTDVAFYTFAGIACGMLGYAAGARSWRQREQAREENFVSMV